MTAFEIFAVLETIYFVIAIFVIERELEEIRAMLNKRKDGEQE